MENTLKLSNKIAYGFSDFGNNLVFVAATNYLMFYYTDVAGLSLAATGILFLVIRIFDAFAGPIFGILVDRTQTKFGKVRPWFLWMSIPYAVSAVLLFSIGFFPVNLRLLLAYVTYAIFTICYAGLGTAINAILPSLSADSNERASANMFRNVLGQTGGLISGLAILPLVSIFGGTSNSKGFAIGMGIFAVILVFSELFTFTKVRENVTPAQEKPVPLHESIKALLPNTPWWVIIITNIIIFIGVVVKNSSMVYFFKYVLNNEGMSAIANSVSSIAMILGAIMIPFVIKKYPMRSVVVVNLGVAVLGQGILWLSAGNLGITTAMLGVFVSAFGLGAAQSLMFVMTAETVDYGEWKFGVRAQGLLTSVSAIGASIGAGLAGVINSEILAAFHFVPNIQQSASGILGINICFIYGPALIDAICAVTIMFYTLDKLSQKMHTDLLKKRQQEINEGAGIND
ncbi:MAG: glycoside-pentoside-hexuronide (GPH):cation symporter [Liquorilactobacillus nagelii]|jgi:sugar (glycoside-pentoside-hexuronide) transporter|uniref:glycoside-pentoside-hexuronide (GPH):cation symporter n=1 Tax=Liquorilactobacillus nagelii TaxID=82688 RepID=UPI00242DD91C|nr:glycoside-pentoside-hexuronide (GPH):cation symporter [Liquorilactobacillus nagelii]MCI1921369.1 glycoside-pentoside-hexuronide (GPH):cation symporter [Liquorilactobacillus nagelii]MCI1977531.1 glycoside-pentoside-hexuronide (GPH):cation symporter [Liquorilactobacillus nagelii]